MTQPAAMNKSEHTPQTPPSSVHDFDKEREQLNYLDRLAQIDKGIIKESFDRLDEIASKREEINSQSNEIYARLRKLGIPTKAARAAYARYTESEEKQMKHDAALATCCAALGKGYAPKTLELFKSTS